MSLWWQHVRHTQTQTREGHGMDGSHFDDLTRAMSSTDTRRRLLAGLAASVLGLVGVRAGEARRCSPPVEICRDHATCCSGTCGEKDRFGRRRCVECQSATVCPPASDSCHVATCDPVAGCVETPLTGTDCAQGLCQAGVCLCRPLGAYCDLSNFPTCCSQACQLADPQGNPVNQCL
jgi:hypothetical protein